MWHRHAGVRHERAPLSRVSAPALPGQRSPARRPSAATSAANRAATALRRALGRLTSLTGWDGTLGRLDDHPPSRHLVEGERRRETDSEAARDVGQHQRDAGHLDRRQHPHPLPLEVLVEQPAPVALRGQAQQGLPGQPPLERCPAEPAPPGPYPHERLVEEMLLLEAARGLGRRHDPEFHLAPPNQPDRLSRVGGGDLEAERRARGPGARAPPGRAGPCPGNHSPRPAASSSAGPTLRPGVRRPTPPPH